MNFNAISKWNLIFHARDLHETHPKFIPRPIHRSSIRSPTFLFAKTPTYIRAELSIETKSVSTHEMEKSFATVDFENRSLIFRGYEWMVENGSLLCRVDCHLGGIRKLRLLRKKYRWIDRLELRKEKVRKALSKIVRSSALIFSSPLSKPVESCRVCRERVIKY